MYLLDTTVFSFIIRKDPLLLHYKEAIGSSNALFLSAMTVCELFAGAQMKGWGAARLKELDGHIQRCTVLPIDATIAGEYGKAIATSRSLGRELSQPDALIVATALKYNLVLVTHDNDMTVAEEFSVNLICKVNPE